jgi:hypothetical protein
MNVLKNSPTVRFVVIVFSLGIALWLGGELAKHVIGFIKPIFPPD